MLAETRGQTAKVAQSTGETPGGQVSFVCIFPTPLPWMSTPCQQSSFLCLACRQQRGADNEAIRAEQALQLAAENQAAEAARLRDYRNELRHRMDIEVSLLGAPYIYSV